MVFVRLTAALGFTAIGFLGLILPILPGWVFFPIAAVLFFPRSRFAHRTMKTVESHLPRFARILRHVGVGE